MAEHVVYESIEHYNRRKNKEYEAKTYFLKVVLLCFYIGLIINGLIFIINSSSVNAKALGIASTILGLIGILFYVKRLKRFMWFGVFLLFTFFVASFFLGAIFAVYFIDHRSLLVISSLIVTAIAGYFAWNKKFTRNPKKRNKKKYH